MVNYPCVVGSRHHEPHAAGEGRPAVPGTRPRLRAHASSSRSGASGCTSFPPTSYNAACVADQDATTYTKGKGTVVSDGRRGRQEHERREPDRGAGAVLPDVRGQQPERHVGLSQGRRVALAAVGAVRPGGRWHVHRRLHRDQPVSGAADHDHDDDQRRRPPRPRRRTPTTTTTTTTPPPRRRRRPWLRWPTPGSAATRPRPTHGSDTALYSVTSSSLTKISYLKFDLGALAGRTLTGASLKVTTTTDSLLRIAQRPERLPRSRTPAGRSRR